MGSALPHLRRSGHGAPSVGLRPFWLGLFLLGLLLFFRQTPFESLDQPWRGPHITEDGWYYYHSLRSLVLDRDLDLANEYREFGNRYAFGSTATGRPHNPFGLGPAVFWTPGFLVGHALARIFARDGVGHPANGYSPLEQACTLLTSYLAGFGTLLLVYAFVRRYYRTLPALLGSLGAVLGGPLLWYAIYAPSMPHALEAFFAAAFVCLALPIDREGLAPHPLRRALFLGLLGGSATLLRPPLVFLLLIPAAEALLATTAAKDARTRLRLVGRYALLLLTATVVFTPQLLAWKVTYGSFFAVPQGSGFLRLTEPLWSETLFSSRNGLFVYAPLLWFCLPGIFFFFRRSAITAAILLLVWALQIWINGAAWDWWAGGAYGGRRFCGMTVVFAVLLSAFFNGLVGQKATHLRQTAAVVLIGCFLGYQILFLHAYQRQAFHWDLPTPFPKKVKATLGLFPQRIYAILGNPFAFPANAIFALNNKVPLTRYDAAVGPYLLDERLPTTNPERPLKREDHVDLSGPAALPFLGKGLSLGAHGVTLREQPGVLFIPLNRTGSLRLEIELQSAIPQPITVSWNGSLKISALLEPTPIRIHLFVDAADVRRGINRLGLSAPAGPLWLTDLSLFEGPDWPPPWARQHTPAPDTPTTDTPTTDTPATDT